MVEQNEWHKPYPIKACRIHVEKNTGTIIQADGPLLTWIPRHAALAVYAVSLTTRLISHSVGEDSTHAVSKPTVRSCALKHRVESRRGHRHLERHGCGTMATDAGHARETKEGSQRPGTHLHGSTSKSTFQLARGPCRNNVEGENATAERLCAPPVQ